MFDPASGRRRARCWKPRGRRGTALRGAEGDRSRCALVHARLFPLQRGLRSGRGDGSRQEDLAAAQIPIYLVATAGFLLADIVANTSPDGTLAQVAAFLPPFSTMVAPARMVVGT